jgi:DNA-binding transcriptional regulator GbsR (MarR family)
MLKRPSSVSKEESPQTWGTQGEFIEALGNLCRQIGLPRTLGQIYGLLFFSERPLSLDDIAERLGVSKASVCVCTRQLAGWGAIRPVWVPGDRRDYFETEADTMGLLRKVFVEHIKPRIARTQQRFDRFQASLATDLTNGIITQAQFDCCSSRLERLQSMRRRIQLASPVLDQLLS